MTQDGARRPITFDMLEVYFPVVTPFMSYLEQILDTQTEAIVKESDDETYRNFVSSTFVGSSLRDGAQPRLINTEPLESIKEIVSTAQKMLFLAAKGSKPNNILTIGYQRAGGLGTNVSNLKIENRFANTNVYALQSREWEILLQRIGTDAMLHLLTKTSLFVSLPNDCLCQLSGEPLIHIRLPGTSGFLRKDGMSHGRKRKSPETCEDERPTKRARLSNAQSWTMARTANVGSDTGGTNPPSRISAADISFIRARLFYARPCKDPDSRRAIVGLPHNHVLNRLSPSYPRKPRVDPPNYVDPDPQEQARQARHLSKYIFPLQYGLRNIFTYVSNPKDMYKLPNFSDHEPEIERLGRCKTPKRLREILPLLDKMIWRHGKCAYKPLRDKTCPSKIQPTREKTMDSSVILEMVSETSMRVGTQQKRHGDILVTSAGNSIAPLGLTQARKKTEHKPRFADFECTHAEVFRYAALITKTVIPKAFWGCEANFKVVKKLILEYISCRRFESFTLHHAVQGFSTSECEWLMPPGPKSHKQARVSVSDALKRRELLEEFIFWYFDSFLLPLLRTSFYVTESSAFRNRILYFRHDDWEVLCAPLIDRLSESTFQEIEQREAEEILRQRRLGFSFVRLLPKDTGVRPIVNLRRRREKGYGSNLSINQILQATFRILTYEKQNQPERLGASVFGPNEIYRNLKDFKLRLTQGDSSKTLPKLYFVKVDVQACFDTIDQSKLISILRDLISEDNYIIQKYGKIRPMAGRISREYVKNALPEDDHPHFLSYARDLAAALRQTIFVDQVQYHFESKTAALRLLEEHITDNIVKIGQKYYRQMIGIPQGSVLSSILCSFCYGDLERRKFNFRDDPESMLLRLIDDYLLVTTSLEKAKRFLEMMNEGHPDYGCIISKEKTMTNFDYGTDILSYVDPTRKWFPWCGLLINMQDLSVLVDYSRYHGHRIQDTLTVDRGRHLGTTFVHKMLRVARARSHIIYTDATLNSEHAVHLNIYQNFLMVAMKMYHYISCWGIRRANNASFIYSTILQIKNFTYATLQLKTTHGTQKDRQTQKNTVAWLGLHAFHFILSKKPSPVMKTIVKKLAFDMSLPRYRRMKRDMQQVVIDGRADLEKIIF